MSPTKLQSPEDRAKDAAVIRANNSPKPYTGPQPPASVGTMDERVKWLASLSDSDRQAFLGSIQESYKQANSGSGIGSIVPFVGGHKVEDQSKDPWIQAEQQRQKAGKDKQDLLAKVKSGTASQAQIDQAVSQGLVTPQDVSAASAGKAQSTVAATTAGTDGSLLNGQSGNTQSQADMLVDPVAAAFSSKNLSAADSISVMTAHPGREAGSRVNPLNPKPQDVPLSAADQTMGMNPTQSGSLQDQVRQLQQMSPDQIKGLQAKLYNANMMSGKYAPGVLDDATLSGYMSLLVDTARANNSGEVVTPDEMLDRATSTSGGSQTQTQINITDSGTAQAILKSALANALGRLPSPGEIQDFTQALQGYERDNPTKSKSKVADPSTGAVDTTVSQGESPTDFADQYVHQNFGDQIGSLNAATTLYRAAMQTLGAGGAK